MSDLFGNHIVGFPRDGSIILKHILGLQVDSDECTCKSSPSTTVADDMEGRSFVVTQGGPSWSTLLVCLLFVQFRWINRKRLENK